MGFLLLLFRGVTYKHQPWITLIDGRHLRCVYCNRCNNLHKPVFCIGKYTIKAYTT